jgi:hypothetical protein
VGTSNRARSGSSDRRQAEDGAFGLAASGVSGPWAIDIDETTAGERRWYAQIEGRTVYLNLEIDSPAVVERMLRFLERRRSAPGKRPAPNSKDKTDALRLGTFAGAPVSLIWDDEFADRCFLLVAPSDHACLRLTLGGEDVAHLAEALLQVKADLEDEESS